MKLIPLFKKIRNYPIVVIYLMGLISSQIHGQQIGDPGWEFDTSKYDSRYPDMKIWATAGVQGGIPYRNNYQNKIEIKPGDDIQKAIDQMAKKSGGGVVILKNGIYKLGAKTISLKSNVRLRGQSKNGVKIKSSLRATKKNEKVLFKMNAIERAGIEDLSVEFLLPSGIVINDDRNNSKKKYCGNCWKNDPSGRKDLYIKFVGISSKTKNSWVDNCSFLNSGTDPIEVNGTHITCRNNLFDVSANKGGGGEGYYGVQGKYGLFVNETVKRIRHFAVQQGAEYNVVINCDFEVDVNFHNKDKGHNLIEKNKITNLNWRGWDVFATGGAKYGHTKPGPNNIIYNNDTNSDGKKGVYGGSKIVYTFTGYGRPSELSKNTPSGGTFYAIKRKKTGTPAPVIEPKPSPKPTASNGNKKPQLSFKGLKNGTTFKVGSSLNVEVLASDADGSISNVKLYVNGKFLRQENFAPYEWGGNNDKSLVNLKKGNYTLKAIATDNKNATSTTQVDIRVGETTPINKTNSIPLGKTIWLKANDGKGDYVVAEKNINTSPLRANRNRLGTWEQFIVEDAGNGKVFLKAKANNKYVQAKINEESQILASTNNKRGWETFTWESKGNAKVALKAFNNKYISARLNTNDKVLLASANEAKAWETFTWGVVSGAKQVENDNYSIRAYPNPTVDTVIIDSDDLSELASINVSDMNGIVLQTIPLVNELDKIEIELKDYSRGVYILSLLSLEGKTKIIKVIKD
ncbi:Ig-like domain-containing protein [Aquimarina agarilytica]|uniref:Ig-like domain-containing protein n=1 Tax=Aquimarina agarilytica TaxID=1087449 RepID=UPI00028944C0|nr:Ig-like domain-containing protein [Aquimarina agarilytica]